MRPFQLENHMKTMRGVFYPTGYLVLMFPSKDAATAAANKLHEDGVNHEDVLLVTPEDFRRDILDATGDDAALPSAGTEGDTVRRFAELAQEGHHALMIHAPSGDASDRVMQALQGADISYGQKYRTLVIEDVA
jgi:hypothetical protein